MNNPGVFSWFISWFSDDWLSEKNGWSQELMDDAFVKWILIR